MLHYLSNARANSFFFQENILLLLIQHHRPMMWDFLLKLNYFHHGIARSIRKFTIPTYPRPNRPITPKNSSSSWFLEDISSSISKRKRRENLSTVAHDFQRRFSYRGDQSTGYIFSRWPKLEKKGERRGHACMHACMHRTGTGTTWIPR